MKGVLLHKPSSNYDDQPETRYHFPSQYLKTARQFEGDWILYYEPRPSLHYKAVARIEDIIADPIQRDRKHYYARIEPGTYLDFAEPVSLKDAVGDYRNGFIRQAEGGKRSHLLRVSVRAIPEADFAAIVAAGIGRDLADGRELPREDYISPSLFEAQEPFHVERQRVAALTSRTIRDRAFRAGVLSAYDSRCAFTRLKFINGGGRAEVQAAHIRPVESGGPDSIRNGMALSGTVHWMFDRGLLSMSDDGDVLVSRHVNNIDEVERLIPNRKAHLPANPQLRPHPSFLGWHRERVFKQ